MLLFEYYIIYCTTQLNVFTKSLNPTLVSFMTCRCPYNAILFYFLFDQKKYQNLFYS